MTAHSLEQEIDTQAHAAANGATLMRSLFSLLGEKWTLTVLTALRTDRRRFSELKREIPGVSQRMLAQTLRELERATLRGSRRPIDHATACRVRAD